MISLHTTRSSYFGGNKDESASP